MPFAGATTHALIAVQMVANRGSRWKEYAHYQHEDLDCESLSEESLTLEYASCIDTESQVQKRPLRGLPTTRAEEVPSIQVRLLAASGSTRPCQDIARGTPFAGPNDQPGKD